MDILKEIEQQINSIKKVDNSTYLDSIFTHIDRAESYYILGKTDNNYFNDVIYRSNQAYEGALKESFKILANKTQEEVIKKNLNNIESFLETNSIFRERVLQLFKNYRQEWRNKSTHDYKLFFDENEAFIAMTSVTSFVHLLLKQIQEKIAFNTQQKKLEDEKENLDKIREIAIAKNKKPVDKLVDMIIEFSKQNSQQIFKNTQNIKEIEIMGLFHAFLESAGKSITTQREPKLNVESKNIRPDFLIEIDEESIILEFKRMSTIGSHIQNEINQLLIYMQATNTFNGIIYYANFSELNPEPKVNTTEVMINDKRSLVSH
ncbi:hypothetical protein HX014_18035 [Myroides marinus]|uniref:hypothetical protein n=1 Tax=Myroides marinus TaxID=703342 RepID=UPI00257692E5|nr:hypothetical protein [Myroides marinus]MDM1352459.1 hypothetical protein [Myroides marinus]MDM1359680.1 hypothetical protein [Myroides marinus]